MTVPWPVETRRGSAADLHAGELPTDRGGVFVLHADRPAVVLGSAQAGGVVDEAAARAAGADVARRRSGGGAVWVASDAIVWLDVVVPRSSPLWSDDVIAAFLPVGRAIAAALAEIDPPGLAGRSTWVHEGALRRRRHADLICFAGTGPGEVFVGPADAPSKVVGISQRRTRHGARFQCAVCLRWDPEPLRSVLVEPPPVTELRALGQGIGPVDARTVASACARSLAATEARATEPTRGAVDLT